MNIYSNPAYSYSNTIVNGYVKTACIQEVVGRSLQGAGFQNTAMTVEMCTSYCSNKGFAISAINGRDRHRVRQFQKSILSGHCQEKHFTGRMIQIGKRQPVPMLSCRASEPVSGLLAVFYGIVRFVIIFRRRVILSQAWVCLFVGQNKYEGTRRSP